MLSGREVSAMAQSIVYRSSADFGVPDCDRGTTYRSPIPTRAMAKNRKLIVCVNYKVQSFNVVHKYKSSLNFQNYVEPLNAL